MNNQNKSHRDNLLATNTKTLKVDSTYFPSNETVIRPIFHK